MSTPLTNADLARVRGILGINQTELAARLDCSQSEVSRWERTDGSDGRSLPRHIARRLKQLETVHAAVLLLGSGASRSCAGRPANPTIADMLEHFDECAPCLAGAFLNY